MDKIKVGKKTNHGYFVPGMFKSRMRLPCGYEGCRWTGFYYTIVRHMETRHPRQEIKIRKTPTVMKYIEERLGKRAAASAPVLTWLPPPPTETGSAVPSDTGPGSSEKGPHQQKTGLRGSSQYIEGRLVKTAADSAPVLTWRLPPPMETRSAVPSDTGPSSSEKGPHQQKTGGRCPSQEEAERPGFKTIGMCLDLDDNDTSMSPTYILPDDPPDMKTGPDALTTVQTAINSTEISRSSPEAAMSGTMLLSGGESAGTSADGAWQLSTETNASTGSSSSASTFSSTVRAKTWQVPTPEHLKCLDEYGVEAGAADAVTCGPELVLLSDSSVDTYGAPQLTSETVTDDDDPLSIKCELERFAVPKEEMYDTAASSPDDPDPDDPMYGATPEVSGGTLTDELASGTGQLGSETNTRTRTGGLVAESGAPANTTSSVPSEHSDVQTSRMPNTETVSSSLSDVSSRLEAVEQKTDDVLRLLEKLETTDICKWSTATKSDVTRRVSVVEWKLDRLLNLVRKLRRDYEETATEDSHPFRFCRSIHMLRVASDYHLIVCRDQNALYCDVCVEHFSPELMEQSTSGTFQYDFNIGSTFAASEKLPDTFCALKDNIERHFSSPVHDACLKKRSLLGEQFGTGLRPEQMVIATRILRTVYYCVKKSLPSAAFEELVALQALNGIDMGDRRHSKMSRTQACSVFSGVMVSKLRELIDTQPCVSLLVRKVTVFKGICHLAISAVIVVVPDAPPSHMVQSFVIGMPMVNSRDNGLRERDVLQSLAAVGVASTEKMASISTNDQQHHDGLVKNLLNSIGSGERSESSAAVPVLFTCDLPNLLNIVDARDAIGCAWVQLTMDEMDSFTNIFLDDMAPANLTKTGKELGVTVLQPVRWSGTSEAAHVISVFRNNIEPMTEVLRRCLLRSDIGSPVADRLREDIARLTDGRFLVRVAALQDIHDVIDQGSKSAEAGRLQPWQSRRAYDKMVASLQRMQRAILASSQTNRTAVQLLDAEDMEQCWPNLSGFQLATAYLPSQVKIISAFCDALVVALQRHGEGLSALGGRGDRTSKDLLEMLPDIREVSDLARIRDDQDPSQAKRICEAMQRLAARGVIPSSAVAPESSVLAACDVLYGRLCVLGNNQELLKVLWDRRSTTSELQPYINTVIRLWLISPADGVAESMVSDVREALRNRRKHDCADAAKELAVRWNGPSLLKADSLIASAQSEGRFAF